MKKLFLTCVILGLAGVIAGLIWMRNSSPSYSGDPGKLVYIKKNGKNFQLIRNGKPFFIKGACGNTNLELLAKLGGNAIRVYDTLHIAKVLDEAEKFGLAVIIDIPIPRFSEVTKSYENREYNEIVKRDVRRFVQKYGEHPALLMWNLCNEVYYPVVLAKRLVNFFDRSSFVNECNFIRTFNELIDIIHENDPNHPVSTSLIAIPGVTQIASIYFNSPKLDLVAFNVFGSIKSYEYNPPRISFFFGDRPYYFSEWGSDGPWFGECESTVWKSKIEPTTGKKLEQINSRYGFIKGNSQGKCLGGMLFYWGQKQECTHTWFSMFDQENNPTELCYQLENLWKSESKPKPKIGLDYMILDGRGARDNILFQSFQTKNAELFFRDTLIQDFKIVWEIYQDAWDINGVDKEVKPELIQTSIIRQNGKSVTFVTPEREGPYRIFAYVYDQNGYFATTNTPFYVFKSK